MMRILIVCPYPHGKAASQRFRFEQYLTNFSDWGIEFDQESFWADRHWPAIYDNKSLLYKVVATIRGFSARFLLLFRLNRYQVVLIHREATPIGHPWWEWAAAKIWKKAIVFDFDDAIWLANSSEANGALVHKWKAHSKTAKIWSWSKMCIAGNSFLAENARKYCANIIVIPTTIDTEDHHKPTTARIRPLDLPVIGWTGSHSTIRQLVPLLPILERVFITHPFSLLIIADKPPDYLPAFAEFLAWRKASEIADLSRIDIGLMPLYDTDWERGKCGFKALQYLALQIPAVVSGVGVNEEIVRHGVEGFVAEPMPAGDGDQWIAGLKILLEDNDLRLRMGKSGRSRVKADYSVLAFRERYKQVLFTSAEGSR